MKVIVIGGGGAVGRPIVDALKDNNEVIVVGRSSGDVQADVEEIYLEDSLERAAQSYRRYLEETPKSARTPEAMRRLADLQIEQAYGVIGKGEIVEMAVPETGSQAERIVADGSERQAATPSESDREFEQRATARQELLSETTQFDTTLPGGEAGTVPAGPREAIRRISKFSSSTRTTSVTTKCCIRCRARMTKSGNRTMPWR